MKTNLVRLALLVVVHGEAQLARGVLLPVLEGAVQLELVALCGATETRVSYSRTQGEECGAAARAATHLRLGARRLW